MNEQRVSKLSHCCDRAESLLAMSEERLCAPNHQDFLPIVWHKASKLKFLRSPIPHGLSSVATPLATQSSSTPAAKSSQHLYTEIKMDSNFNIGRQCNELAIGAINLNAGSQAQDKSSLSYYRLFYTGKPVSEFCCKACNNGLGHIAPDKCYRCRAFAGNLESSERKVVGFTQLASGIMMGEYLVSGVLLLPLSLQAGS